MVLRTVEMEVDMTRGIGKTVNQLAREYRARHPKRSRANWYANYYRMDLKILHRCNCRADWRVKHHPNYDYPEKIMDLCAQCHKQLHANIYHWNKAPFRNHKWIESILGYYLK